MIRFLRVALLMVTGLAAQAVPICLAVTEDDARSVIGPSAKRTKDPSGCGWESGGHKAQMSVVLVGVPSMYERARAGSAQKGTVKEESGLGGAAFSTVPSAQQGARAAIYLLKGSTVLIVDIDGFGPGGAEAHLSQVRDLVRKLGGKL